MTLTEIGSGAYTRVFENPKCKKWVHMISNCPIKEAFARSGFQSPLFPKVLRSEIPGYHYKQERIDILHYYSVFHPHHTAILELIKEIQSDTILVSSPYYNNYAQNMMCIMEELIEEKHPLSNELGQVLSACNMISENIDYPDFKLDLDLSNVGIKNGTLQLFDIFLIPYYLL